MLAMRNSHWTLRGGLHSAFPQKGGSVIARKLEKCVWSGSGNLSDRVSDAGRLSPPVVREIFDEPISLPIGHMKRPKRLAELPFGHIHIGDRAV